MITKASDVYAQSVFNKAIKGVYLFETLCEVPRNDSTIGPLMLNVGRGKWIKCEDTAELFRVLNKTLNDYSGLNRNLSWDFGLVLDEDQKIIGSASTNGRVHLMQFIGKDGGPLERTDITFEEIM